MRRSILLIALVLTIIFSSRVVADDWNQWLGSQRDSIWRESGIITEIPESGLNVLWRAPISGGFSGPAVADGRAFVSDYKATDGDQTFDAGGRSKVQGKERVHCFDAETGKPIWEYEYDCPYNISYGSGPRATPTVDGDRVYVLGAEGHLTCLKVADGELVWQKDFKKEYDLKEASIWGFASHPLVVGDTIYCLVGGEGSVAVAFDKLTGDEKWRALSTSDIGYCPPTLIKAGGADQLLIWHSESINSLNPLTGDVYWSVEIKPAYGMSIIAPTHHGDHLLLTGLQGASMLLKLDTDKPGATEVWRGNGLHPDHNPPIVHDNHIYGVDDKGHLRCIEMIEGKRVWESTATMPNGRPAAAATCFIVKNGEHWYLTTEQGELIIAQMSPEGFTEIGRTTLLDATSTNWGRQIVWSHPAYANQCIYARNDKEIVCISLAK